MQKHIIVHKKDFSQNGYSLIELVIFIVVTGIVITAMLIPLSAVLERSTTSNSETTAVAYAQERIELILQQRNLQGYSSFSDPCSGSTPPTICTIPSGYSVASTIVITPKASDAGYKTITVKVTNSSSVTIATLATIVGS